MNALRKLSLALIVACVAPALAAAQAAPAKPDVSKIDLTGKWQLAVQSDAGSGTPTLTLRQKGDTLTGTYISQALGNHDFVGTNKAGKINFGFDAESGGMKFTMTFSGTVDDKDSISGSLDFAGMATGSFSGKRIKE